MLPYLLDLFYFVILYDFLLYDFLLYEFDFVVLSLVLSFDDQGSSLSAADAKCCKSIFGISLDHFMNQSDQDSCSGCSDWMTKCNCSAVYVQLGSVKSKIFSYCYGLCRKSFICLDQVKIGNLQSCFVQSAL